MSYFLRDRSLGQTVADLGLFLDLGFVYRAVTETGIVVIYPLCLPAECALISFWKEYGLAPKLSLQKCIQNRDGPSFEALAFHALVSRYHKTDNLLPLRRLGHLLGAEELVPLNIDMVVTSSMHTNTSNVVAGEIKNIRAIARKKKWTILYRCPKGTEGIDFCILRPTGVWAIQVSLSSLTDHQIPNHNILTTIDAYTPQPATRGHDWRYIHLTTSPQVHPIIGLQKLWYGVEVDKIRLLDANTWLCPEKER